MMTDKSREEPVFEDDWIECEWTEPDWAGYSWKKPFLRTPAPDQPEVLQVEDEETISTARSNLCDVCNAFPLQTYLEHCPDQPCSCLACIRSFNRMDSSDPFPRYPGYCQTEKHLCLSAASCQFCASNLRHLVSEINQPGISSASRARTNWYIQIDVCLDKPDNWEWCVQVQLFQNDQKVKTIIYSIRSKLFLYTFTHKQICKVV